MPRGSKGVDWSNRQKSSIVVSCAGKGSQQSSVEAKALNGCCHSSHWINWLSAHWGSVVVRGNEGDESVRLKLWSWRNWKLARELSWYCDPRSVVLRWFSGDVLLLRLPEDVLELSWWYRHDEVGRGASGMLYAGLVTRCYTISWMCRGVVEEEWVKRIVCQSWDVGGWVLLA